MKITILSLVLSLFSCVAIAQDAKSEYERAVLSRRQSTEQVYRRFLREEVSKAIGLIMNISPPVLTSFTIDSMDLERGSPETWYAVVGDQVCRGVVVSATASSVSSWNLQHYFDKNIVASWKLGDSNCINRSLRN